MQPSTSHDDAAKAYGALMAINDQISAQKSGKVLLRTKDDSAVIVEKKGSVIGRYFKIIRGGKKKEYELSHSIRNINNLLSVFKGKTKEELNALDSKAFDNLEKLIGSLNGIVEKYNSKHKSHPLKRLALPFLKGVKQTSLEQKKFIGMKRTKPAAPVASTAVQPVSIDKRQAEDPPKVRASKRIRTDAPETTVDKKVESPAVALPGSGESKETSTPKLSPIVATQPPSSAKVASVASKLGKPLNILVGGAPPKKELTEEQKKAREKEGVQATSNILKGRAKKETRKPTRKPREPKTPGDKEIERATSAASTTGVLPTKSKELSELENKVKALLQNAGLSTPTADDPFKECVDFNEVKNVVKNICVGHLGGNFSALPEVLRQSLVNTLSFNEEAWFKAIPAILADVKKAATSS